MIIVSKIRKFNFIRAFHDLCFVDSLTNSLYMARFALFTLYLICIGKLLHAQEKAPGKAPEPAPYYSIYLIGDTGDDTVPGATLRQLGQMLENDPQSAVAFLGDNVYPHGLDKKNGSEAGRIAAKKLSSQLSVLANYYGKAFMVPGNHDWKNGRWQGLDYIRREATFVDDYLKKQTPVANKMQGGFFPKDGMPGPWSVLLKEGDGTKKFAPVRMVFIDTQWWLQAPLFHPVGRKLGVSRKEQGKQTFDQLDSILNLADAKGERVVLCMHHPLFSNGMHATPMQPIRFLTNIGLLQPLGIFGLNRFLMQSLPQPRYQKLRRELLKHLEKHKGLIVASGHDHDMEYFQVEGNHFVVSGAGSKLRAMGKTRTPSTFTAGPQHGFVKLSFFYGNKMKLEVWSSDKQQMIYSFIED